MSKTTNQQGWLKYHARATGKKLLVKIQINRVG
jgi:hypothetical protein